MKFTPLKYLSLSLLLLPQLLWANDAWQMLIDMSKIAKTSNYEATLLTKNQNINMMKLFHKAADLLSKEQEKLTALDGELRELIVDGNGVMLYKTANNTLPILRNPFVDTFVNMPHNLSSYQISKLGLGRTLGRTANVLLIKAVDDWRYSYKLWLDAKTNMYLRALWLDKTQVIAEAILMDLKFHHEMLPLIAKTSPKPPQKIQLANDGRCHVAWLPRGFNLLHRSIFQNHGLKKTEHLVFTDGIAKISVYLDFANMVNEKNLKIGRTNIFSMPVDQNNKIIVVGEAPMHTIKKIARSVLIKFQQ